MSDFLTDRPTRKAVARKLPTQSARPVFLITSGAVFAQRDKRMGAKKEFSAATLSALHAAHPDTIFVVCVGQDWQEFWEILEKPPEGMDVRLFRLDEDAAGETSARLRAMLVGLGVRFKPIRNPRTVSYLNIHKFILDDTCCVVGRDEYEKLGIDPDKELTFQDMANKRARSAWP